MVFGCFRSVLNSQHGDVNGFFNGFQASKSWNAGRYLNQRRTGWWHQCRHVDGSAWRYPSAIGWVGWLNSMSWESVSVTHLDVPGFSCGKVHILSGANDPSKNAVLIVKFWWLTLKSWNIQSNTVDFHTQTADLLCGCFSNLERPAYYSRWHLFFFLCVCFWCWIFDAAGSTGDGEKNKALEDGIGAFGASHLPLEIQQWTLFNFFGSFVYEHILILDHILDKFGSINQFWPNVMEYQMRVRIQ